MIFKEAERLGRFETGIFASLNAEKEKLIKQGKKIYNLFIGTPDFEPPVHVKEALISAASDSLCWKYSLAETDELLEAVCDYYMRRFGVKITPDMITAVNGSQEGMGHIGMALCNKGDVVLLPDPGYPAFYSGAALGEADVEYYPLIKENGFLPRLDLIDEEILKRTKYIVLSYPSNPVGAAADKSVFEEVIGYAKKYGFAIINDNAYSDILFDGREAFSFLSLEGAYDLGAEFFSLSKSFNVTGARISFLIGNKSIVGALKKLRSQYDFGMFYPVQKAAVAALTGPTDSVEEQRCAYQRRRDALLGGLKKYGWDIPLSDGTMFVWAPLPNGFTDSKKFCEELVRETGVLCTPGIAFGPHGEGYVRFALVLPEKELAEIADIIGQSGFLDRR
jgi:LL-diaminopimelate aminotransferase